jgi:hypothetical protein
VKKLLVLLIVAALAAGGYWLYDRYYRSGSPSDAYLRMINAARLGDEEAFLDGFTDDSSRLVKALIALSRSYEVVREDPYQRLVFSEVVSEQVDGERALLVTQENRKMREIHMVRVDGEWKIDAFELEKDLDKPGLR